MNTKEVAIKLANEFVRAVLISEPWFSELYKNQDYSLLILTGSTVQGNKDSFSDLDLFLVVPYASEIKYKLSPEYTYLFKKISIEVSLVTTEKLVSDQKTKKHVHWWKNSVPLLYVSDDLIKTLEEAGSMSIEDKKDHLWTLMCLFEMNIVDMERIIERNDVLSFDLNLYDCLRIFCEFMLLDLDIMKRFKWYGKLMSDFYPQIFEELRLVTSEHDYSARLNLLKNFRGYFTITLNKNGFSEQETSEWYKHNLTRLLFQKF